MASIEQVNGEEVVQPTSFIESFDFLHPYALKGYDLSNYDSRPLSAILTTYNRCPHEDISLNPLQWALMSLLEQKYSGLSEIVVVDDGSTDNTPATIAQVSQNSSVPIYYVKKDSKEGICRSRNIALDVANQDLVFLMDDDCVLAPHSLFGLQYTHNMLSPKIKLGAIHPPVYHRSSVPVGVKPSCEIGNLDVKSAKMSSSYNYFPEEILDMLVTGTNCFLDDNLKIIKPISVKNLMGVFLVDKHSLITAGGFPEQPTGKTSWGTETELAVRFMELGNHSFFQCDPKVQAVHFKYGFSDSTSMQGKDWKDDGSDNLTLADMVRMSNHSRSNTGDRVGYEDWAYAKISSGCRIFKSGGLKNWIQETYDKFVVQNSDSFYSYPRMSINDNSTRKRIWWTAVEDAVEAMGLVSHLPQYRPAI